MEALIIFLSVCLHAQSAKEINHSEDAQLDELLSMIHETTTQHTRIFDTTSHPQPYFEPGLSNLNNTVQFGTEVTLHCYVKDMSDHFKVSWLKRSGDTLRLISIGSERYSSDARYIPGFSSPRDWQLKVHGAVPEDQGIYECQISSHPPLVQRFYLTVVVPELEIADERGLPINKKFYNSGSTIELKCLVSNIPDKLHFIMWRLGDRVLNYDQTRGGITVKNDVYADGVMSRLFIANSNQQDSGNYTCSLGEMTQASVTVVVLTGESPAAMHVSRANLLVNGIYIWISVPFIFFQYR